MTLRLRSGQALITFLRKSAESIKERIKSYVDKLSFDNTHYTKMASVAILSVIVPLSVIPAIADQKTEDQFTSKVVLNKNANIVEIASKHSTIVPGESRVQSEARVAAEAAKAAQVASSSRTVIAREKRVYNDPANFDGIYQSAGAAYGIDWRILKAVHYVETGASGSTSKRNPSGATGPMQFIPSTWRAYGVDGNGDDVKDITNVEDAIYAAANYLSASGGSMNGYKTALWSYNPSTRYFAKVMDVARSLGF